LRRAWAWSTPRGIRCIWPWAALTYFPWLWWEIAKSAWTVAKLIVHPRLPISPTMTQVAATQKTTVGVATYANSITLTPGTVTLAVDDDELAIRALTPGAVEGWNAARWIDA
jgi:multicomponent Na+:H+ antiporter subunit E